MVMLISTITSMCICLQIVCCGVYSSFLTCGTDIDPLSEVGQQLSKVDARKRAKVRDQPSNLLSLAYSSSLCKNERQS